jgi:DNA polymerase III delta subunit
VDFSAFTRRIKEDPRPAPVYAFYGAEPYLMQRGAEMLCERYALRPSGRREGSETPWSAVAEAARASFLGEAPGAAARLLTLVYRDDVPADHADGLAGPIAGPTVLCVHAWMNRLPFKTPPDLPTIRCDRPDGALLAKWVRKELGRRGRTISSDALRAFVEGVQDRPLHACLGALESVAAHAGAGAVVERADVEPFVAPDLRASAFKICDALAQRQAGAAAAVLRDLLARDEPPLKILGAVHWGLNKAREAHERRRRGQDRLETARALGIRFHPERYVEWADRMGAAGLRRAFDAMMQADELLKSSGAADPGIVMEIMIHRLARATGC